MTIANLTHDGNQYAIACKNHATGSQETCTAVSCLLYSVAGWLENEPSVRKLVCDLKPGDARIVFSGGEKAQAVYDLVTIGLLQIEKVNGKYIKVCICGDIGG